MPKYGHGIYIKQFWDLTKIIILLLMKCIFVAGNKLRYVKFILAILAF